MPGRKLTEAQRVWQEEEKWFLQAAFAGLLAAVFLPTSDLFPAGSWKAAVDWRITLGLFTYCVFLNVQQHMLEIRLNRLFYVKAAKAMSNPVKSLEQALTQLFLIGGLLLCGSIVHLYLFLAVLPVFRFFCLCFDLLYYRCQRSGKVNPEWAAGKFDPARLFRSWILINLLLASLWLAAVSALWVGQAPTTVAKFFIPAILLLDVGLDWCMNWGFYFKTYVEA